MRRPLQKVASFETEKRWRLQSLGLPLRSAALEASRTKERQRSRRRRITLCASNASRAQQHVLPSQAPQALSWNSNPADCRAIVRLLRCHRSSPRLTATTRAGALVYAASSITVGSMSCWLARRRWRGGEDLLGAPVRQTMHETGSVVEAQCEALLYGNHTPQEGYDNIQHNRCEMARWIVFVYERCCSPQSLNREGIAPLDRKLGESVYVHLLHLWS